MNISANNMKNESEICEKLDIFTDPKKLEQVKRIYRRTHGLTMNNTLSPKSTDNIKEFSFF